MHGADAHPHTGVLRIFISYRRQDAPSYARELYQELRSHFKDSQIFWDIKMELGVDFVKEIERAVGSCDVLIAVIGPHWLAMTDEAGQRRLDDPADFVRLEIVTALNRNIRVIPVLVQGATMPAPGELPEALRPLARRSAIELSDKRWEFDVSELIAGLHRVPYQKLVPPTGRGAFPAEDGRTERSEEQRKDEQRKDDERRPDRERRTDDERRTEPRPEPIPKPALDPRMIVAGTLLGVVLLGVFFGAYLFSRSLGSDTTSHSVVDTPVTMVATTAPTSAPTSAPRLTPTAGQAVTTRVSAPTATSSSTDTASDVNYADELTDFGVAPISGLQTDDRIGSPTPISIPGGTVVTTLQLVHAMQQANSSSSSSFVLIDALAGPAHATIPGAESMPDAGSSGYFLDSVQQELKNDLSPLTDDDLDMPLVFFCQGARCWESYNASLRAMHLGYTHVYWYRGGLAAWQAAGLPLTNPGN